MKTTATYATDSSESCQVFAGAVLWVPPQKDILAHRALQNLEGHGISPWDDCAGINADGSIFAHPILVVSRHGPAGEDIHFLTVSVPVARTETAPT